MNVGDRVELIHTSDRYTSLQRGTKGTVQYIDDITGTVDVKWDTGQQLGMVRGEDRIRKINEEVTRA